MGVVEVFHDGNLSLDLVYHALPVQLVLVQDLYARAWTFFLCVEAVNEIKIDWMILIHSLGHTRLNSDNLPCVNLLSILHFRVGSLQKQLFTIIY